MGFCLFSSAAIAARYAQTEYGAERVAVLDFDVHHGNGTQAAFWDQPDLLYASSHQMPLYPGTGAAMNAARMTIFLICLLRKAQLEQRFSLAGENSFCRLLPLAIRI